MTVSTTPTTLNLLSRILELEFGASPLQHYGLFTQKATSDSADENTLPRAQQRFAAKLREIVERQDLDASVMAVGDSLLPLAESLAQSGRKIHWVGSKRLLHAGLDNLENFRFLGEELLGSIPTDSVDLLLLQGSMRYLDQMALLSKSRDLLAQNAQLVHFGEFLSDDSKIEYSLLPNLSSFLNISRRLGFDPIQEIDLSSSALRSLELLSPLVGKHSAALTNDAGVDAQDVSALGEDFDGICSEFASGRRVFKLFIMQRDQAAAHEWSTAEFGAIDSFDPAEVAQLFEKSFGVSFNAQLWHWKYVLGDGKCVVARLSKEGEIVAHYGGAPRQISYFGKASTAIQPCDVMVHPSIRKQYGKGSLFFEVAATFLEREIGNTVRHLLGFGFPNQKTMNISKRLGLYEKTDDFIEIVYAHGGDNIPALDNRITDYNPLDQSHVDQLNALWVAMKADYAEGIIGVRDAQYINYRYIVHPFAQQKLYRCVLIGKPDSAEAAAFAVLKRHGEGSLLMDLICPGSAMKSVLSVINQYVTKEEGSESLRVWVSKSGQDKLLLPGAAVNELGIEIPCNSWNPGPSAELLSGAWWLTAGDMDFV